jgi:hypothetical protein
MFDQEKAGFRGLPDETQYFHSNFNSAQDIATDARFRASCQPFCCEPGVTKGGGKFRSSAASCIIADERFPIVAFLFRRHSFSSFLQRFGRTILLLGFHGLRTQSPARPKDAESHISSRPSCLRLNGCDFVSPIAPWSHGPDRRKHALRQVIENPPVSPGGVSLAHTLARQENGFVVDFCKPDQLLRMDSYASLLNILQLTGADAECEFINRH